jgi:hypothetical protein
MVIMYYKTYNPQIGEIKLDGFLLDSKNIIADLSHNHKDFEKYFVNISQNIANNVSGKNTFQTRKGWVNYYKNSAIFIKNELAHTHEDIAFIESGATHLLVQVLETGYADEVLSIYDNEKNKITDIPMVSGDIIVFHRSVYHGLEQVNNLLRALVLGIEFN